MIEVRILTPDDWPAWRALRLAALADAPYAFMTRLADWQGDSDREERWRARLNAPGSHHVIAVLDGAPAGLVAGWPAKSADIVDLVSMWVSPDARGRGVGDALIGAVESWAIERGAQRLRLSVAEDNHHASALYQRHGFHWTGEFGDYLPDGVRREQIMVKPLTVG